MARHLAPESQLLGERAPGLTAEGWFHTEHMTYPYGVQIAVVRIDRETGAVKVERYLVAFDIGKAVNPMLVRGTIGRAAWRRAWAAHCSKSSSTTIAASRYRSHWPTT